MTAAGALEAALVAGVCGGSKNHERMPTPADAPPASTRTCRNGRAPAQASFQSSVTLAFSTLDTGQPALAPSAIFWNWSM